MKSAVTGKIVFFFGTLILVYFWLFFAILPGAMAPGTKAVYWIEDRLNIQGNQASASNSPLNLTDAVDSILERGQDRELGIFAGIAFIVLGFYLMAQREPHYYAERQSAQVIRKGVTFSISPSPPSGFNHDIKLALNYDPRSRKSQCQSSLAISKSLWLRAVQTGTKAGNGAGPYTQT